jgi:hypothetical protein
MGMRQGRAARRVEQAQGILVAAPGVLAGGLWVWSETGALIATAVEDEKSQPAERYPAAVTREGQDGRRWYVFIMAGPGRLPARSRGP